MDIERRIRLASIYVEWSPPDVAFVARSTQYPGLIYRDGYSSLGAVDGLMNLIRCRLLSSAREPTLDPTAERQ